MNAALPIAHVGAADTAIDALEAVRFGTEMVRGIEPGRVPPAELAELHAALADLQLAVSELHLLLAGRNAVLVHMLQAVLASGRSPIDNRAAVHAQATTHDAGDRVDFQEAPAAAVSSVPIEPGTLPAEADFRRVHLTVMSSEGSVDLVRMHQALSSVPSVSSMELVRFEPRRAEIEIICGRSTQDLPLFEALTPLFWEGVQIERVTDAEAVVVIGEKQAR